MLFWFLLLQKLKKSNAKTNNHLSHVATIRPVIDNIEEMFKNEQ